ncbi:hypothetical protein AAE485_13940 [Acidithiobacillus ferriphilus]
MSSHVPRQAMQHGECGSGQGDGTVIPILGVMEDRYFLGKVYVFPTKLQKLPAG